MTRKVTHLVVKKPEGRKYAAARNWKVQCVTVEWLYHSLERGMVLSEECYDPVLPANQIGHGAWTKKEIKKEALGKRLRDGSVSSQDGVRKLRKTASMKLSSQSQNMWASILGTSTPTDYGTVPQSDGMVGSASFESSINQSGLRPKDTNELPPVRIEPASAFSHCVFYAAGYSEKHSAIVARAIISLGGRICSLLQEAVNLQDSANTDIKYFFLVVPQNSQPDTHPRLPSGFHIVTEFYIEKCLHKKQFYLPHQETLGQPFPLFPISKFMSLNISISGFTNVDLQQVEKAIKQLGATFAERFTPKSHLLICNDLERVRPQKIDMALNWRVPIVSASWLWECISCGARVPLERHLIKELHQQVDIELPPSPLGNANVTSALADVTRPFSGGEFETHEMEKDQGKHSLQRTRSEPPLKKGDLNSVLKPGKRRSRPLAFVVSSDEDEVDQRISNPVPHASGETAATSFRTAPTYQSSVAPNQSLSVKGPVVITQIGVDVEVRDGFQLSVEERAQGQRKLSETNFGKLRPESSKTGGRVIDRYSSKGGRSMSPTDSTVRATTPGLSQTIGKNLTIMDNKVEDINLNASAEETLEARVDGERTKREEQTQKEDELARQRINEEEKTKKHQEAQKERERQALKSKLVDAVLGQGRNHDDSSSSRGGEERLAGGETTDENRANIAAPTIKRKRGVFGRAISNVSVGSVGSGTSDHQAASMSRSENDDIGQESVMPDVSCANKPPPATQIGYVMREEKDKREDIMTRLNGGGGCQSDIKHTNEEDFNGSITIDGETLTIGKQQKAKELQESYDRGGKPGRTTRRLRKRQPGF